MPESTNGQSRLAGLESQLERLLACDLSEMGYQARVRHQQRIEELRVQIADAGSSASTETRNEPSPITEDHSAVV